MKVDTTLPEAVITDEIPRPTGPVCRFITQDEIGLLAGAFAWMIGYHAGSSGQDAPQVVLEAGELIERLRRG